jgi:hypothetical protein
MSMCATALNDGLLAVLFCCAIGLWSHELRGALCTRNPIQELYVSWVQVMKVKNSLLVLMGCVSGAYMASHLMWVLLCSSMDSARMSFESARSASSPAVTPHGHPNMGGFTEYRGSSLFSFGAPYGTAAAAAAAAATAKDDAATAAGAAGHLLGDAAAADGAGLR